MTDELVFDPDDPMLGLPDVISDKLDMERIMALLPSYPPHVERAKRNTKLEAKHARNHIIVCLALGLKSGAQLGREFGCRSQAAIHSFRHQPINAKAIRAIAEEFQSQMVHNWITDQAARLDVLRDMAEDVMDRLWGDDELEHGDRVRYLEKLGKILNEAADQSGQLQPRTVNVDARRQTQVTYSIEVDGVDMSKFMQSDDAIDVEATEVEAVADGN